MSGNETPSSDLASPAEPVDNWVVEDNLANTTELIEYSNGLNALSAAAMVENHYFSSPIQPTAFDDDYCRSPINVSTSTRELFDIPGSPLAVTTSPTSNLDFILNPVAATSFRSDPNIGSSYGERATFVSIRLPQSDSNLLRGKTKAEAETSHDVAFLLRHFSEVPGKW